MRRRSHVEVESITRQFSYNEGGLLTPEHWVCELLVVMYVNHFKKFQGFKGYGNTKQEAQQHAQAKFHHELAFLRSGDYDDDVDCRSHEPDGTDSDAGEPERREQEDQQPEDDVEDSGNDDDDEEYAGTDNDEEEYDGDDGESGGEDEEEEAPNRLRRVEISFAGGHYSYTLHPGQPDPFASENPLLLGLQLLVQGRSLWEHVEEQLTETLGDNPDGETDNDGYPTKVYFGDGNPNELTRTVLNYCLYHASESLEHRCLCQMRLHGTGTTAWRAVPVDDEDDDDQARVRRYLARPGELAAHSVEHYLMMGSMVHDLFKDLRARTAGEDADDDVDP